MGSSGGKFTDWRDRPCWRCGYPLRSLLGGDVRNCPECGLAVRISLSGNSSLVLADPDWLFRQGLGCLAAAAATAFVAAAGMSVLLLPLSIGPAAAGGVAGSCAMLGSVVLVAGWWMLAAPDRNQPRASNRIVRAIARAIFSLIVLFLGGVSFLSALANHGLTELSAFLIPWVCFVFGVLAAMSDFACGLMIRSQHRRLRKWTYVATRICWIAAFSPCLSGALFAIFVGDERQPHVAMRLLGPAAVSVVTLLLAVLWWAAARQVIKDRTAALVAWTSD